MQFDAVCTIKNEITKENFLRLLMIKLGTNKDTPLDAVDAEFQEVRESFREAVVCTAYVEGDCSASVGYHRQEAYIAYESYREKVGDRYVTKQRPVTKYKTVTDWHPFNTHFSGETTQAVYNNKEDESFLDRRLDRVLGSISEASILLEGDAEVNSQGLETAKLACEVAVRVNEVDFPGDVHKGEHYKASTTVKRLSCYILPYYEVTYTYRGEEYTAGGFACGTVEIEAEYPPNDFDITDDVQKKTKHLETKEKNAWWMYTGSMILAFVLCFVNFTWVWPVTVVLLVLAQKSSKDYRTAYQQCSDELSKDVMKAKIQALKEALEKRNMEPMSERMNVTLEDYSVEGAKEPKSMDNRIKGCWILTALLIIASLTGLLS